MITFQEFGLNSKILRALSDLEFETPTPVQKEVIPLLQQTERRDVIALAQTGTGKTAAFGLPIMQMLDSSKKHTQALILSPTRELCKQICDDLMDFSKYSDHINITAVYGGASIIQQIKELERGAQIVVATPGRMIDLLKRGKADFSKLDWFVLDEADEMLNMGFQEDIQTIFKKTPATKNTLLFSATMPKEIEKIARTYMQNPIEVCVGQKNSTAENIEHVYYRTQQRDKYQVLKRIADYHPDIYGLIFCRTKIETQEVADALMKDGYNAEALHGDLSQAQRDSVMKKFRSKTIQMLVATDVAARGIDVDDLTHVINYALPDDIEQYTHRCGRTGRAGKSGVAISIITAKDEHKVYAIEKQIKKKLIAQRIPEGKDVCEKQLMHQIHIINNVEVNQAEIEKYLPQIMDELNSLSREELIKKFVSTEFNRFLSYYKNAADLNVKKERNSSSSSSSGNGKSTRMFISLGKLDEMDRDQLRTFVGKSCNINYDAIVNITTNKTHSFFDVSPEIVNLILDTFKTKRLNGRSIRVDIDGPEKQSPRKQRSNNSWGENKGGFRRDDNRRDDNRRSDRSQFSEKKNDSKRRRY